jgi:hypothetical protein
VLSKSLRPWFHWPDVSIAMDDLELALFCSEAAAKLADNDRAALQIDFAARTALRGEIAQLDTEETLTAKQRMHRSNREASLVRISPRLGQLERAIPILLTDDDVRSPWLIGPSWPKTALALRDLSTRSCARQRPSVLTPWRSRSAHRGRRPSSLGSTLTRKNRPRSVLATPTTRLTTFLVACLTLVTILACERCRRYSAILRVTECRWTRYGQMARCQFFNGGSKLPEERRNQPADSRIDDMLVLFRREEAF